MTGTLLRIEGLTARYGTVQVLHGVDLEIGSDEIVALLGPNGAGKTTLLRALSRVVSSRGRMVFDGTDISSWSGARTATSGVGHVPEGRGTFVDLTVDENLRLGALARPRELKSTAGADLDMVYETFPVLQDMRRRTAGLLSGGQQQMLAVGRALMARPRLLLIDEPSLGLAPIVTRQLFDVLAQIRRRWSVSLLIAEQNARLSLEIADRAVVLAKGQVAVSGSAEELGYGDAVRRAYLGVANDEEGGKGAGR
ncbi:ABC transporter ATP-binding protein [Agromyces sp. Soil535]|uniref:ABC transporter ATP-binding protein n=1 Tax=Agromyces sp. Soil535 TaxID=1736390 RepID=UPI0006F3FD9C|nr:ABC transporter ATP-binding protein [Agromyces sp. Soil535]KRE22296.1 hypothetical protein ASG80_10140 [Agromyces sp. Soil535]